jgi:DNA-binding GntR family transcriptional regulator
MNDDPMKLPVPSPASRPAGIDRQGLASAVTLRLRDMIIEGTLAAGTRLNERVLCEQLMVSRTPLREAFKVLAGEGLIELLPNRGAQVAEMSLADIEQTFEVLGTLEGLSGQLACQRITEAEITEIRALHYEMLAAHARRDLAAYYKINHVIHDLINASAGNAVLTATYLQMNARIQNLRFRSNFNHDKWNAAMKEHSAMLEALERRDGPALRAILERHLLAKRDTVVADLRPSKATPENPNP